MVKPLVPAAYYLDCEMVMTINGPNVISIAFGNNTNTYKFMVESHDTVTDYLTHITGVRRDMTIEQAIGRIKSIICNDDILIGHHLYNDLRALNLYHGKILDTCMIYHHPDGLWMTIGHYINSNNQ